MFSILNSVFIELVYPLFQLPLQEGFVGQIERILRSIDISIFGERQLYKSVTFFFAKKYTNGGFLKIFLDMTVVIVDIHLHLTQVLMGQVTSLQVNQHIALQQSIVEHKVYIEMSFLKGEAFLAHLELKALPKFQ